MMNEEQYLKTKIGNKNPFTVPDGYFEQLTTRIMSQLPESDASQASSAQTDTNQKSEKKAIFKTLRPWLLAAACLCVAVFMASTIFSNKQQDNEVKGTTQQVANAENENNSYYSDKYIEEEADYAMLDTQDIYGYLLAEM